MSDRPIRSAKQGADPDAYEKHIKVKTTIKNLSKYLIMFVNRTNKTNRTMSRRTTSVQTSIESASDNIQVNGVDFELIAVIEKEGSLQNSGHYVAHIKCNGDRWYTCNDSLIIGNVPKEKLGNGVFYVYRKFDPNNDPWKRIKLVPLPNIGNTCWLNVVRVYCVPGNVHVFRTVIDIEAKADKGAFSFRIHVGPVFH